MNERNIPAEYKPIGAWGYLGYQLLFNIPVVGFIFVIIYAIGGTNSNINLRNYARYNLIVWALALVLSIVIILFFILFVGSIASIGTMQ